MSGSAVIEMDRVTRGYGKTPVLKGLTLRIPAGTSYGLLGRNGAGKTTALRVIMGLLRPGSGTVRLFGKDPAADPEGAKADVGYVAEDQELPAVLTPRDLFRLFADLYPRWDPTFQEELIGRLAIPLDRRVGLMSQGQKRQVALVCAVAHRPKLLVLDEPSGGLDPVVRREFLETVVRMLGEAGSTVLFSSHVLHEVERVAGKIGILHQGELLLEEDLDRLRENSCRALVSHAGPLDRGAIPGCVRVSGREGLWTLTVLAGEEEIRSRIRRHLGVDVRQVQPLSLEDLFVDLVGRET